MSKRPRSSLRRLSASFRSLSGPKFEIGYRGDFMTIGILQSTLFGDMFGTAPMRAAFGELAFIARCVEVEAALARAQARLDIVPDAAAAAISAAAAAVAANPESLDLARLKRETETVGYPILPLVRQLA